MKCNNCGATISDTASFCTECGAKIEKEEKKMERGICPHCGEKLREGASFCVGCGKPVQTQNKESVQNQNIQSDNSGNSTSEKGTLDSELSNITNDLHGIWKQAKKNKGFNKLIKIIVGVLAGIAIIYACLVLLAVLKSIFSSPEDEEISIVETKDYISPDLKLFDLQGDIKECWQSSSLGIMDELTLTFDEKGKLTSIRNRRAYREREGDGVYYGLARDNEGRIVQFHQVGVFDMGDEINIHYDNDGIIAKINGNYIVDPFEITYNYENGELVNAVSERYFENGDHLKTTYTLTFENMDEYGNWLTCKRYSTTTSYNSETGEIYEETENEMTISRNITYYSQSSNSQNSASIGNEASTEQREKGSIHPNTSNMESFYRKNYHKIKEFLGEFNSKNATQYALKDLDGDGNDEFFITDADVWYTSVFTATNGEIKTVTNNAGMINSVYGQLLIYGVPGSSWGCTVYCLFDNGNVVEGMTGTTVEGEKFYLNDKECTQEEFEQYFSQYKGEEELLEWKPLSEFISNIG